MINNKNIAEIKDRKRPPVSAEDMYRLIHPDGFGIFGRVTLGAFTKYHYGLLTEFDKRSFRLLCSFLGPDTKISLWALKVMAYRNILEELPLLGFHRIGELDSLTPTSHSKVITTRGFLDNPYPTSSDFTANPSHPSCCELALIRPAPNLGQESSALTKQRAKVLRQSLAWQWSAVLQLQLRQEQCIQFIRKHAKNPDEVTALIHQNTIPDYIFTQFENRYRLASVSDDPNILRRNYLSLHLEVEYWAELFRDFTRTIVPPVLTAEENKSWLTFLKNLATPNTSDPVEQTEPNIGHPLKVEETITVADNRREKELIAVYTAMLRHRVGQLELRLGSDVIQLSRHFLVREALFACKAEILDDAYLLAPDPAKLSALNDVLKANGLTLESITSETAVSLRQYLLLTAMLGKEYASGPSERRLPDRIFPQEKANLSVPGKPEFEDSIRSVNLRTLSKWVFHRYCEIRGLAIDHEHSRLLCRHFGGALWQDIGLSTLLQRCHSSPSEVAAVLFPEEFPNQEAASRPHFLHEHYFLGGKWTDVEGARVLAEGIRHELSSHDRAKLMELVHQADPKLARVVIRGDIELISHSTGGIIARGVNWDDWFRSHGFSGAYIHVGGYSVSRLMSYGYAVFDPEHPARPHVFHPWDFGGTANYGSAEGKAFVRAAVTHILLDPQHDRERFLTWLTETVSAKCSLAVGEGTLPLVNHETEKAVLLYINEDFYRRNHLLGIWSKGIAEDSYSALCLLGKEYDHSHPDQEHAIHPWRRLRQPKEDPIAQIRYQQGFWHELTDHSKLNLLTYIRRYNGDDYAERVIRGEAPMVCHATRQAIIALATQSWLQSVDLGGAISHHHPYRFSRRADFLLSALPSFQPDNPSATHVLHPWDFDFAHHTKDVWRRESELARSAVIHELKATDSLTLPLLKRLLQETDLATTPLACIWIAYDRDVDLLVTTLFPEL